MERVVGMTWLVRLYPHDWRERYEEEFAALLEQCSLSPLLLLDILIGALDARLNTQAVTGGRLPMIDKLRASEIALFCAYIGYVVAGLGFYGMLDDNPLVGVARTHPDLSGAVLAIQVGAVLSLLAVLAGGLPIGYAALRRALAERRRDILLLFAVPPMCLALLAAYGVVFVIVALLASGVSASTPPKSIPLAALIAYFGGVGLFLLAAIASAVAVALAVARSHVEAQRFRRALVPGALATLAMVVTLAAALAWGLSANADAPQAFYGGKGLFGFSTAGSWLSIVAVMAMATLVAAAAVLRGFAVRSASAGAA